MTGPGTVERARDWRPAAGTAVVAALAIPVGLGFAVFGFFGWCVGPVVLVVGLVGRHLRQPWGSWLIAVGAGLALGALAYITVGLLIPDGPSSGGGSSRS